VISCDEFSCNPGVYVIINIVTGKAYIGSGKSVKDRLQQHLHSLRRNAHYLNYFQKSWNKHGECNFVFMVLSEFSSGYVALIAEQFYLDTFFDNLYNISRNAYSCLGVKRSDEFKKHQSESILSCS